MEHDYIQETLSNYDIIALKIELLRHDENLTYRIGDDYLLQIHEPVGGFEAGFFYVGTERIELYKAELAFQAYLKRRGMRIREAVENRHGELIMELKNGTYAMLYKWVEGESLDKLELNDDVCLRISEILGDLHHKAKGFQASPMERFIKALSQPRQKDGKRIRAEI